MFATAVAASSHVLAGGDLPSPAAILLSLALSLPFCVLIAGPALTLWRTALAVFVTQAVFHLMFSGISSAGGTSMSEHAGHDAHGGSAVLLVAGEASVVGGHSASMWFAHAIAGLVTVVAVRHAESALVSLRETAILLLGALTLVVAPVQLFGPTLSIRVGCTQRVLVRDLTRLFSALRHRGPPTLVAA
jgi:hypothetical protein